MNIREKLNTRLEKLEQNLKDGRHLASSESRAEVEELANSISKFISVLPDEDRDFVMAAKLAIAESMVWK